MSLLQDLTNHGLLSADDEFGLARQFKVSLKIQEQKKKMENSFGRPATNEELASVLQTESGNVDDLLSKGDNAKNLLVKANMRLVFHIAKYYRLRGVAYPDLVQEGTFGLIKAVEKYNPERGFRFSTYASWWIKQSISRAVAEKSRIVRLPVHIHDMLVSVNRAEKQFQVQYSRKPTASELAGRLGLPVSKVELLMSCGQGVNSIDQNLFHTKAGVATSNEIQVKDRLISNQRAPATLSERHGIRSRLKDAMSILSEREAQIVQMRFGLTDGRPMTLEEIGTHFDVTRERIRQIESRALAKMRHNSGGEIVSLLEV